MPSPEIRAVAENLICALRFFGYARGTGEIRDLPGLSLITCGLNYAAFNAALLSKPIESDGRELSLQESGDFDRLGAAAMTP